MPTYVQRDIQPTLREMIAQFPAVAVTGPRQSGKTTLLQHELPDHAFITLDDPLLRRQALDDPELLLNTAGERLVIDEIQYAVSLLPRLKMRIDQQRDLAGRFVLTGSQQFALMKSLGETLAGRIGLLELPPFSVNELARGLGWPADAFDPRAAFEHACLRGCYPEPALQPQIAVSRWYGAYVQTYLERDIRSLYDIGSLRDFDRFLQLLAARCAQTLNLTTLATDVGVGANTIKRWISILEASRIVYLLPPYHANLGKRIVKAPKVYFLDCGLVCYLAGVRDAAHLFQGPLAGPLFENFCVQEAVKACLALGAQPRFSYLRTSNGLEVDFLADSADGGPAPFEFKLSQTPRLEAAATLERFTADFAGLQPQPGAVVSLGARRAALTSRTQWLPVHDFLDEIRRLARV
jgi:predicted AAA+ superfamily ATPase